ncbi:PHP domain-containing protein [Nakamurella silvestris]|nr:PHP domain-containing protein [Nakamurella silvestris]
MRAPFDPATMLVGDHHVHSTFSDDAVSSPQDNLEAAAAAGLTQIRMVDHVRISTPWVPEFVTAIRALPPVEGLTVFCGVESKILDAAGNLDLPTDLVFGSTGIDSVLIADHQFPGPDGPWSPRRTLAEIEAGLSPADAVDILITATIRAIGRVPAAQLAHPLSLLPKIGLSEDDVTDDHLTALADAAVAADALIEFNEKWRCPGRRALDLFVDRGVHVVASTDSHTSGDVGRYQWVRELLEPAGHQP